MSIDIEVIKNKIQELESKPYNKAELEKFVKTAISDFELSHFDIMFKVGLDNYVEWKLNTFEKLEKCKNYPQSEVCAYDTIKRIQDFAQTENKNNESLRNLSQTLNIPYEQLEKEVNFAKGAQIQAGNMKTEDNNKLATQSLYNIAHLLNENKIDYTVVGAVPCYFKSVNKLVRYHDDIDIMLAEKDVEKVKQIFTENKENLGFNFNDDRNNSKAILKGFDKDKQPIVENGGAHEVYAQKEDSEFHIGFFLYEKNNDKYSTKRYYKDEKTNQPVALIEHEESEEKWKQENNDFIEIQGQYGPVKVPCCTTQSVYDKKGYIKEKDGKLRPKDMFDRKIFESHNQNLQKSL